MRRFRRFSAAIQGRSYFLIASFALASCVTAVSADTTVTFRADENWEATAEIVFTPQQVQLLFGQIDQALAQAVSDMRVQGVEAEWKRNEKRRDDNVGYTLSAKGQGLDKLNATFFNNAATLYVDNPSGRRQIVFSYYPGTSFAETTTFTLVGGRIISTNGTQMDSHTVTWVNPTGQMEAVLTESPRYSWLPYALIGAGALLLVIAVVGVRGAMRRRSTSPMPIGSYPMAAMCPNCGSPVPAQAVYCPRCGAKR